MGAKSQLNGGIFYIILWLMHVLQALSDKKIIQPVLENACAARRLHEIKTSRKKWTKWSKFTLKQQKQKTKHVIFGTYRQFKNITPKIKGPKIKALYNQ
ncbi:hypothetical protein ACLADJ_000658 [Escherichia coli]